MEIVIYKNKYAKKQLNNRESSEYAYGGMDLKKSSRGKWNH